LAKPEWGAKRLCQSCGAKFYDLKRTPITCPKCAAVLQIETETRRRPRPPAPEPVKKRPPDVVVAETEEVVAEVGEGAGDAADVLEDTSDLGADEEYEVNEAADEEPS